MRDRSLSVLLHVSASTSFLILGEQAQRLTSDMESSEESVALKGIEPTNSAVLERDTHDLHGQQRKMSGGGPRAAVRRTRTVITKKEAALRRPFQPLRAGILGADDLVIDAARPGGSVQHGGTPDRRRSRCPSR